MPAEKLHRQHLDQTQRKAQSHSAPPKSVNHPVVLCIGGSDSSGLAGLQMDARFCQAMNVHQACVLTAITAQNSDSVSRSTATSITDCQAQFDAAMALQPQAIKIGLIASLEQLKWLCELLPTIADDNIPVIYDPVTVASSGSPLADASVAQHISQLLPHCDVITPNLPEAESLSGTSIRDIKDIRNTTQYFHQQGAEWVYLKGGHGEGTTLRDIVSHDDHIFALEQARQDTRNLRGTGCALASSIAATSALGYDMIDALVIANMAVAEGICNGRSVNHKAGPISANGFPKSFWPHYVDLTQEIADQLHFPDCIGKDSGLDLSKEDSAQLGLYPVVDSYEWLVRLLPLGIHTIQLRIKNVSGQKLREEIEKSIALAQEHQCRLFINDHWQLALELGAYGIHLGQEDLDSADLKAIADAGIRLGISNHTHFEIVRCLAIKPSYIACGPVFATQSKDMPWIPHGLEGLQYWCDSLINTQTRPLVAIGGINESNISDVAKCGSSGIALISAITAAVDPEAATLELMRRINLAKLKSSSEIQSNTPR